MANNNGLSTNQLVFSKNPNYPAIEIDLPSALENKMATELVQENLNSLYSGRENFIKVESSEKLKRAIKYNKRTHADIVYKQGDKVAVLQYLFVNVLPN